MIETRILQAAMFLVIVGIVIGFAVEWYSSRPMSDRQHLDAAQRRRDLWRSDHGEN